MSKLKTNKNMKWNRNPSIIIIQLRAWISWKVLNCIQPQIINVHIKMKPSTILYGLSVTVTASLICIIFKYMIHWIPQLGPGHSRALTSMQSQTFFWQFHNLNDLHTFPQSFTLFLQLSIKFCEFCGTLLLVSLS